MRYRTAAPTTRDRRFRLGDIAQFIHQAYAEGFENTDIVELDWDIDQQRPRITVEQQ
jgi:hypothetical protein